MSLDYELQLDKEAQSQGFEGYGDQQVAIEAGYTDPDRWSSKKVEEAQQADQLRAETKAAEERAAAEKKAVPEKNAAEEREASARKAAEEKLMAEKKAAEESEASARKAAEERDAAEACRQNLVCLEGQFTRSSTALCPKHIERLANYDFEWTNGFFEPIFSDTRWLDTRDPDDLRTFQSFRGITFIGDKLKFQNGFGAWQNIVYECDFDIPVSDKPVEVRVRPGRL